MGKLRALVVDDDDMVRAQVSGLLLSAGHNVYELPSAIGVTRMVLRNAIQVVIIDIAMPSLTGDKLTQLLRDNPKLKHLGVVLISSRPADELERVASEVHADAVVTKAQLSVELVAAAEQAARLRGAFG